MSLPQVISAYNDCLDYFAQAVASKSGIRIMFEDKGTARYFQMRMTQARSLHRDETRRLYPRDHPLHGRSEYDVVQVRTPVEDVDGNWWIYVERHNARALAVEEIDHET